MDILAAVHALDPAELASDAFPRGAQKQGRPLQVSVILGSIREGQFQLSYV